MQCIYCQLFCFYVNFLAAGKGQTIPDPAESSVNNFLNKLEPEECIYAVPALFSGSFLQQISFAIRSPGTKLYHQLGVPGRPAPPLAASDSDLCRHEGLFTWNSSQNRWYLMWLIRGESHPFRRPN